MYEDPFAAVAARRAGFRAEAERSRLVALARGCRASLVRRLAGRLRHQPVTC